MGFRADVDNREMWVCAGCGMEKRATAHQVRQTYCSKGCMSQAYRERLSGEANPNFKDAGKRQCVNCGAGFNTYSKSGKYCSRKCYADASVSRPDIDCAFCGATFRALRKASKYCSAKCCMADRVVIKPPKPPRKERASMPCRQCGKRFHYSPSENRKFCSYDCFKSSGGPHRAGQEAVRSMKKYGAKKDANHAEIFSAIRKIAPAKDLSAAGFGVPDGLAWINGGWHFFDVKNPKTGYGKRGLNKVQKKWAADWQGGPVFLIYTRDEAIAFAKGDFDGLSKFPPEKMSAEDYRDICGAIK